jgi:phage terminase large subunit GpA-like protein
MPDALALNLDLARESWAEGLRPEPLYTVSQWADRYRVLPQKASAEPGPYRSARTPYLREIMDSLSVHDPTQEVVVMKGAQIGATEAANNLVGYIIHHAPAPVMMVLPTAMLAQRSSRQRIAPMIADTPALATRVKPARMRDSGNTLLAKEFPGGILVLAGANSAVGLRSMPARYLILDELDAYPTDINEEGDPVELAIRRTATFGRKRKLLKISTPKVAGKSRIESAYEDSDQRRYLVPCPHCGSFQTIDWARLQQPGGKPWSRKEPPTAVVLVCDTCEIEIQEHHKTEMLAAGYWQPTADGAPFVRGYHLSALYSPVGWYTWLDAALDHLKAKDRGPEHLKTWTNTVLGETWEEETQRLAWEHLFDRREAAADTVPRPCLVLTAGVDVQHNRLEVGIWGWNGADESWAIDHQILMGDPDRPAVWRELTELLGERWPHESGATLSLPAVCIDSGYATQAVYEFTQPRWGDRVYACKGFAGPGRPMVGAPSKKRVKNTGLRVRLYPLGVDALKSWVYNRLRHAEPGPGYVHIPHRAPFDERWHQQLTAEEQVNRFVRGYERRIWRLRKGRRRNEVLDCAVLARAALVILDPDWPRVGANLNRASGAEDKPKQTKRPHRRKNWAHRW